MRKFVTYRMVRREKKMGDYLGTIQARMASWLETEIASNLGMDTMAPPKAIVPPEIVAPNGHSPAARGHHEHSNVFGFYASDSCFGIPAHGHSSGF